MAKAVFLAVGVPSLPNGSCTLFDWEKPGGHAVLKQQVIGELGASLAGQDGGDDVGAEESDGEGVFPVLSADAVWIRVFIANVCLQQIEKLLVHLLIGVNAELEHPEQGGLGVFLHHAALAAERWAAEFGMDGGNTSFIECHVVFEEGLFDLFKTVAVLRRKRCIADSFRRLCHELSHIAIVKVRHHLNAGALEGEPVAECNERTARRGVGLPLVGDQIVHVGDHGVPVVGEHGDVTSLEVKGIGQDNGDVAPPARP